MVLNQFQINGRTTHSTLPKSTRKGRCKTLSKEWNPSQFHNIHHASKKGKGVDSSIETILHSHYATSYTDNLAPQMHSSEVARKDKRNWLQCSSCSSFVSLLASSTLLHVLFERRSFVDGFAAVFVFESRADFTGVVFTTHGPAEFGSLVPVSLVVVNSSGEGRLGGRDKGRSTGEKSGKDNKLVLRRPKKKDPKDMIKVIRVV